MFGMEYCAVDHGNRIDQGVVRAMGQSSPVSWDQVIPRDTGEAQLAIVGKGNKPRNILIPADVAVLRESRGEAPASERVSPSGASTTSSRRRQNGRGSLTLVSQTLGHADLKTTSVYPPGRTTVRAVT